MTNKNTNRKLMALTGYGQHWLDKNPDNEVDYFNDWNALMPLAVEFGIWFAETKNDKNNKYVSMCFTKDGYVDLDTYSNDPATAIIKCLIAKLESEL